MRTPASSPRLVELSGGQVAAILASIGGGVLTWVAVTRTLPPAQVGQATALVALGTLVSGLVAAGLGQYLLAALPGQQAPARRRTVIAATVGGLLATAVVATLIVLVGPRSTATQATVLVAFAVSVTLLSIQDAVYLCAGSATDVVAKAVVVSALRPLLVLVAGTSEPPVGLTTYDLVVVALLIPNVAAGLAWLVLRVPKAIDNIPRAHSLHMVGAFRLLSIGYQYALAGSLVSWGVPALATNFLAASESALFYIAWTISSVVGSVPFALANVVVARGRGVTQALNGPRIVMVQVAVSSALALAIFVGSPWLLRVFGDFYGAAVPMLGLLLVGQVLSGTSAVLIGFGRRTSASLAVGVAIAVWACGSFAVPALAAVVGGANYPISYAAGSAVGLLVIAVVLRQHIGTVLAVPAAGFTGVPVVPGRGDRI